MNTKPPVIEQEEMTERDIDFAEAIAKRLGYTQTAYTSTSSLWGLFCLQENPGSLHANSTWRNRTPYIKGCIIKTAQFGFMFVADLEDLQLHDLAAKERKAV